MANRIVRWDRKLDQMTVVEGSEYADGQEVYYAADTLDRDLFDPNIVHLIQSCEGDGTFAELEDYDFWSQKEDDDDEDEWYEGYLLNEGYWLYLQEQYDDRFDAIDDRED